MLLDLVTGVQPGPHFILIASKTPHEIAKPEVYGVTVLCSTTSFTGSLKEEAMYVK